MSRTDPSTETESRLVVAWRAGVLRGMKGTRFFFRMMECSKMIVVMIAKFYKYTKKHELYPLSV